MKRIMEPQSGNLGVMLCQRPISSYQAMSSAPRPFYSRVTTGRDRQLSGKPRFETIHNFRG